jgi:hypothetical protein
LGRGGRPLDFAAPARLNPFALARVGLLFVDHRLLDSLEGAESAAYFVEAIGDHACRHLLEARSSELKQDIPMALQTGSAKLATLTAYAAGLTGTRSTIEALGVSDYADLIIAMAETNLAFPKPSDTDARRANVARARAILLPRLRDDD